MRLELALAALASLGVLAASQAQAIPAGDTKFTLHCLGDISPDDDAWHHYDAYTRGQPIIQKLSNFDIEVDFDAKTWTVPGFDHGDLKKVTDKAIYVVDNNTEAVGRDGVMLVINRRTDQYVGIVDVAQSHVQLTGACKKTP